ncbi:DUF7503 family protein [Halomicrococcus sp. NG-SE-24]
MLKNATQARLAQNPRLIGILFTIGLALSQAANADSAEGAVPGP